ncbi:ATP-binding protein [Geofilum sp. OHC36d9]|uniref:ATP-binding protein n=1 Tax=Geofilum sp. OHC36d9 TaxID=3458413 RepID=UPI0040342325
MNPLIIISFNNIFLNHLLSVPQANEANMIETLQAALYATLILVGVAMVVFFYLNLRKNLRRKQRTPLLKPETPDSTGTSEPTLSFDQIPIPTALCDSTGIILYANRFFANVFGSTSEHINKLLIFNILPSNISQSLTFTNETAAGLSGHSEHLFFSPNTNRHYSVSWEKADKKIFSANSYWVFLETTHETTAGNRKNTQSQEDAFLQAIDFYPSAIFIEDLNGVLLAANKTACQMQNIDLSQIKTEIITNTSLDEIREELLQTQPSSEGSYQEFKTLYYPSTGKAMPAQILAGRFTYFDRQAVCYIVKDLSDFIDVKKELEDYKMKSEESDRLKSSFLSNLSHEVRTPLNSILGFSELLAEPDTDRRDREEYLRMVRQSGKNLLTQISNMIDFSKIEAGLINIKAELCNIETLFHHLHEYATEDLISDKPIQLYFELPEEISQSNIITDRFRLKQILKVFLSNALKYTDNGVVEIGVKLKAPQLYEFYVRDTGIGIPEEKHAQIFENFRQADDTKSRNFNGMGLGLSIAARLIQFLGGHQWVVSQPQKGSEFRFVVPDSLYPLDSPIRQVSGGPSTMIKKIMIISPNESIYSDLSQDSKPINYQIFWAQNSSEMKSMMLSNKIRIILIDIDNLPFWQELVGKINAFSKDIRIVGISNTVDIKRKERLMTMGLNNVIKTTINIPVLLNILERNEVPSLQFLTTSFNQN